MLESEWGSRTGDRAFAPPDMHAAMGLVRLPLTLENALFASSKSNPKKKSELDSSMSKFVQDFLHHESIEVPVKCLRGGIHLRISAHVYNELADYEALPTAISKLESLLLQ